MNEKSVFYVCDSAAPIASELLWAVGQNVCGPHQVWRAFDKLRPQNNSHCSKLCLHHLPAPTVTVLDCHCHNAMYTLMPSVFLSCSGLL